MAAARETNERVHRELGTCDDLSTSVEALRREWAAEFHGHTTSGWAWLLTSRIGRVADDLAALEHTPTYDSARRGAIETLLQASAVAQILAQQLADEQPAGTAS